MYYADIKQYDISNGPGVRISLFVSGCTHRCKNCFNEVAWDFNYGEPFERANQQGLLPLLRRVRERYPKKTIWCFSGYLFDRDIVGRMVEDWPETKEMLSYIDVLVDGEFIEEEKDLTKRFKGSANQRTIDVPASLKEGRVVIVEGYE